MTVMWIHDCLLQWQSQNRIKWCTGRVPFQGINLRLFHFLSFRINQARVYLQAYRVGYKIQCPDRKGRWVSPEKRSWLWDHIPRHQTSDTKLKAVKERICEVNRSDSLIKRVWLFHLWCHFLTEVSFSTGMEKCTIPVCAWQLTIIQLRKYYVLKLVLVPVFFLYIIHGCIQTFSEESEVTLYFQLNVTWNHL